MVMVSHFLCHQIKDMLPILGMLIFPLDMFTYRFHKQLMVTIQVSLFVVHLHNTLEAQVVMANTHAFRDTGRQ